MRTESIDHGRVFVSAGFTSLLRANGLDSFESIMALAGGRVARDFPGRRTVRLELKSPAGTKPYTDSFYACHNDGEYIEGIGEIFSVMGGLSK